MEVAAEGYSIFMFCEACVIQVYWKAFFEWNRTIVEIGFLYAIPYNKLAARENEKTTVLSTFWPGYREMLFALT